MKLLVVDDEQVVMTKIMPWPGKLGLTIFDQTT